MLSRDLGGIQQAYLDYYQALTKLDYEVINISSWRAKINSKQSNSIKLPSLVSWCFLSKIYLFLLCLIYKPDVIIAHGGRAINFTSAAKPRRVKSIGVAHNYTFKRLKKCNYVIAITEHIKQYMINNGYDSSKIFTLPNMISIQKKYKKRQWHNEVVIGSYGRFVEQKGYNYLLESIALLHRQGKKVKLILGGEGADESSLKKQACQLGIKNIVIFYGWVNDKESFFDKIDIFCLPSIHEPFGIVLLEAMEHSIPIISTKCEGPQEILEHEKDGLLVDIESANDIANSVSYWLENPDNGTECAKQAYNKLLANYDINTVNNKLAAIIEKCCPN